MTTTYIKGNALEWAEKDGYCMIHVCNNKGVMGSGIALQVKSKYPEVYESYIDNYKNEGKSCGRFQSVANLIAQNGYYGYCGKFEKRQYLVNEWLTSALENFMYWADIYSDGSGFNLHTIVVPYKMGAERSGGDWNFVISEVERILGSKFDILVVEYDKGL